MMIGFYLVKFKLKFSHYIPFTGLTLLRWIILHFSV